jgi:hypothetical protein
MKSIYLFGSLISILLLTSCQSDTSNTAISPKPVVEGYLAPGYPVALTVTTEIPYSESATGTSEPIVGLAITLSGNGKKYTLKSLAGGVYQGDKSILIAPGQTYAFEFDYNNKKISGSTVIPTKPKGFTIDKTSINRTKVDISAGTRPPMGGFGGDDNTPITLTWINPDNDFHFVVVDNIETIPDPILTLPSNIDINRVTRRFRNEPVQGLTSRIIPQQFQFFGNHRIILFKINPDYVALYKTNNTSSQNITTPPTSIANGLGIFTGVNADTLAFRVNRN